MNPEPVTFVTKDEGARLKELEAKRMTLYDEMIRLEEELKKPDFEQAEKARLECELEKCLAELDKHNGSELGMVSVLMAQIPDATHKNIPKLRSVLDVVTKEWREKGCGIARKAQDIQAQLTKKPSRSSNHESLRKILTETEKAFFEIKNEIAAERARLRREAERKNEQDF